MSLDSFLPHILQDITCSSKSFPRANNVSSQAWLNILRLSLHSTSSKSHKFIVCLWVLLLEKTNMWNMICLPVSIGRFFFCIGSPPRNWSFSWTRNNLHDSFGNLWIQSFKLYLVSNVNPEKSNSSVPAAKSMPANDWLINRGCVDPDITSLRKDTFQELKFDSCGQGSNSNFSASATDRVSDKVVDIDGLCSHGLSSAGRNVGNGESTFSVGENGCEQSIPDAGRMIKWVMRGVRLPAILFVLCSATSLVSYCFGFLGSTNCRCLRHFILMRNRQLLCADNSLPLTVWGFLENFPSDTSSWDSSVCNWLCNSLLLRFSLM